MFLSDVNRVIVLLAVVITVSDASKILGVFPTPGKSHFIIGQGLMKGLAKAGHEVTVINPYPQKTPIPNYTDVSIFELLEHEKETMGDVLNMEAISLPTLLTKMYKLGVVWSNFTLSHPNVVKLLNSNQHFDLVICEVFLTESLFGFADHYNAPLVGVSTFGASKWTNDLVGTPAPLSYVPHPFLSYTDKMSFTQKLMNVVMTFIEIGSMNWLYYHNQEALYDEKFPNAKKSYKEMQKNVSLVLLNHHFSISSPRPYAPNMIEVGGMHIEDVKPLPDKIKKFLDDSPEGVVYFSMGSIIQGVNIPIEKRNAFIKVFSELKQKVLWKYENDTMPDKPDNVMIAQWMPQNDILAHPNVKLFITHGGLLGSTEALYHGKAVIGIPIYGDQRLNIARAELLGYGVQLEYSTITEDTVRAALNKVLGNPSYMENVKTVSSRFRDKPLKPLETAVYWIEYVIRHRGAPHLHSTAVDLNFFEYHLFDVYLFIISVLVGIVLFIKFIIKKTLSLLSGSQTNQKNSNSKKKKKQ